MTSAMSGAALGTAFRVDGAEYGGGRFTSVFDRYAAAWCTADADRVARRLPSPDLHPLRWRCGRAELIVDACDRTLSIGDLPPLRYGQLCILAWVSHGRTAAPPLLPFLSLGLPLVGDRLLRRYGNGAIMLASIVTNRVAAEISRILLGEPSAVGEVRIEQGPDHLRYSATDQAGSQLHLHVPTGGLTQSIDSTTVCCYSARGSDLVRQALHNRMRQSLRLGRSSARLEFGHHEWAALARDLGMSTRPWGSVTWSDATETMERLDRIGTADHRPAPPTGPEPVAAPFVIRSADGIEDVVDQHLDQLPFSPGGTFEPAHV